MCKEKNTAYFFNFEVAALPTYKQSSSLDRVIFIFFHLHVNLGVFYDLCFNILILILINLIILCLEISAKEIIFKKEKFSGIKIDLDLSLCEEAAIS